jgi:hypothetical protein
MIRNTLALAALAVAFGTAGAASHMEKAASAPMPTASGVKAAAKKVGHEVAKTGRQVGHNVAEAGRETGHAVAEGTRKVKRKAKAAAEAASATK